MYVSVYVCIPVREPHALSAEVEVRSERAGRPQVILTILRPCTTGGTKGGQGVEDEVTEKWNNMKEDRGE